MINFRYSSHTFSISPPPKKARAETRDDNQDGDIKPSALSMFQDAPVRLSEKATQCCHGTATGEAAAAVAAAGAAGRQKLVS